MIAKFIGIAGLLALLLLTCRSSGSSAKRADRVAEPQLPALDSGAAKLVFQDQADDSFRRFRSDLLAALARRDTAFLFGILEPEIRNSFGDNGGIREFKAQWRIREPDSPLWNVLTRALEQGGRQEGDTLFYGPYVYAFWPDSVDAFDHLAVVVAQAKVRSAPLLSSPPFGTVGRSILGLVELVGERDPPTANDTVWAHVILPDGRRGWLRGEDGYSPVGWRAVFAKREGRWRLRALVAGD
jgi:hypothetical protein